MEQLEIGQIGFIDYGSLGTDWFLVTHYRDNGWSMGVCFTGIVNKHPEYSLRGGITFISEDEVPDHVWAKLAEFRLKGE